MLLNILWILVGLGLLAWSADRFVDGASALARNLGVSSLVVGLIVVGFGTSAPELLVSTMASFQGDPALAMGNALGSNVSNIALVVGATAAYKVLPVQSTVIRREFPVLGIVTLLAFFLLVDGELSRVDGVIFMGLLVASLLYLFRVSATTAPSDPIVEEIEHHIASESTMPTRRALAFAGVGLVGLLGGSKLLVLGASEIAAAMGVSELVIGLTIVAIGTSLPELAAAIVSARRNETDLVIGNVVGSNLFNNLGVLGIPGLIDPTPVPAAALWRDYPIMIALTVAFFVMSSTPRGAGCVTKREGRWLLVCFVAYQLLLYSTR